MKQSWPPLVSAVWVEVDRSSHQRGAKRGEGLGKQLCASLAMFPSHSFYAHFEVSHQKRVMETPNLKRNPLIRKKVFMLAWGGFWLVRKRVNVNNGRCKCILQINPAWAFKKVMWLCTMGRHNLTNPWTDFVAQHLKCCYGHSEVPEQSLSSKYFCIIASQNALPQLRSQTADI